MGASHYRHPHLKPADLQLSQFAKHKYPGKAHLAKQPFQTVYRESKAKYSGSVFETEAQSAGNNQAHADKYVNRGREAAPACFTEEMNIS